MFSATLGTVTALLDRVDAPARYAAPPSTRTVTLAAGSGRLLDHVAVCKVGSFHGGDFVLDVHDLNAAVARFGELYPHSFVPPVRVDHGYSARDVVGYIEALSVEDAPDESDGGRVIPFLFADLRIVDDTALAELKAGKLRFRSAEWGAFRHNNGTEYPLILWGVAFVDIPEVSGLPDIQLDSASRAAVVKLTSGDAVSEQTPEPAETEPVGGVAEPNVASTPTDGTADASEVRDEAVAAADDAEAGPAETQVRQDLGEERVGFDGTEESEDDAGDAGDEEASAQAGGDADAADGGGEETGNGRAGLAAARVDVAALRAAGFGEVADEIERLRTEGAERALAVFRERGIVVDSNRAAAERLLRHADPAVRQDAHALLDSYRPPVELDTSKGNGHTLAAIPDRKSGDGGKIISLGMSKEEVGPLWASLSTEERRERQAEYDAWYANLSATR